MKKGCGIHQMKWESVRLEILGFSLMRHVGVAEGKMGGGFFNAQRNAIATCECDRFAYSVASPSSRCIAFAVNGVACNRSIILIIMTCKCVVHHNAKTLINVMNNSDENIAQIWENA